MAKKHKSKGLQHIGIERRTLKQDSWRGLSASAKIFYIHLKGRYNGGNNGQIRLSYRSMRDVKGCSDPRAISKAIKELEKKKWVKIEERGGLYRHNNFYKLTFKHDFYGCDDFHLVSKSRDKNKQ